MWPPSRLPTLVRLSNHAERAMQVETHLAGEHAALEAWLPDTCELKIERTREARRRLLGRRRLMGSSADENYRAPEGRLSADLARKIRWQARRYLRETCRGMACRLVKNRAGADPRAPHMCNCASDFCHLSIAVILDRGFTRHRIQSGELTTERC